MRYPGPHKAVDHPEIEHARYAQVDRFVGLSAQIDQYRARQVRDLQALLNLAPEFQAAQPQPVFSRLRILLDEPQRNERGQQIECRRLVQRRGLADVAQAGAALIAGSDYIDDGTCATQCLNSHGLCGQAGSHGCRSPIFYNVLLVSVLGEKCQFH